MSVDSSEREGSNRGSGAILGIAIRWDGTVDLPGLIGYRYSRYTDLSVRPHAIRKGSPILLI